MASFLDWYGPHPARTKENPPRTCALGGFRNLAERTGLEPATPGVTGRYSNRLNYRSASVQLSSSRIKHCKT